MKTINSTNIEYWIAGDDMEEVQFDTHDEKELAQLFWDYLKENDLINVTKGKTEYETGVMVEYI